jgi:hypothetical protein
LFIFMSHSLRHEDGHVLARDPSRATVSTSAGVSFRKHDDAILALSDPRAHYPYAEFTVAAIRG